VTIRSLTQSLKDTVAIKLFIAGEFDEIEQVWSPTLLALTVIVEIMSARVE
jgi:hypothetical protein